MKEAGSLFLSPLAKTQISQEAFPDRTGYEALVNKFNVDDYFVAKEDVGDGGIAELAGQGVAAARRLACRLEHEGRYRVFLSLDPDSSSLSIRFFERRAGEDWGGDDPDSFTLEEVLILDTDAQT